MILRPYQQEAIDSVWDYYRMGNTGNPVIALPTGTGKSLVIAGFIQSVYRQFPDQRITMLTHVKELIEQNHDKLMRVWPAAPCGIYSAGIGRKDVGNKITFAGIQSAIKNPHLFGHQDLVFIDECQLVSPKQNTSYVKFLNALSTVNPHLKAIGLSATPYRLGLGHLTSGGLFTDVCFDRTSREAFNQFIYDGYLTRLVPKPTKEKLNVDGVRLVGGEFNTKDLETAVNQEAITYRALQETLMYAHDRKKWLIFATGVEHCYSIQSILDSFGITCAVVHGNLGKVERATILADYEEGKYQALINNNVLTTGFDSPYIDCIVVLRPTNSPGLWVQMLGRGTRPVYAPGYDLNTVDGRLAGILNGPKPNCLVLDFAGNTPRLGPINDPVLPKPPKAGGKKGEAPVKICEKCNVYQHTSARICDNCGYTFPVNVRYTGVAGTNALIAENTNENGIEVPQIEEFGVDKMIFAKHMKAGRPPSLKVTYYCGFRRFTEYVCLEHDRGALAKAKKWWSRLWPEEYGPYIPASVDEALAATDKLGTPSHIRVWLRKKYPEIKNHCVNGEYL